jgi:hypothetical protein
MTSKEFKDWFEGFAEGCEAEKNGFTPEQVKRMLDVARGCKDAYDFRAEQQPYIYTIPNPYQPQGTTPPFNQPFSIDPVQPMSIPLVPPAPTVSTVSQTFIPENKSGSKMDAMKLIQGLKMAKAKEKED